MGTYGTSALRRADKRVCLLKHRIAFWRPYIHTCCGYSVSLLQQGMYNRPTKTVIGVLCMRHPSQEFPNSPRLPISSRPASPGPSSQCRPAAPRPRRRCLRSRSRTCSWALPTGSYFPRRAWPQSPWHSGCFFQPWHRRRRRRRRAPSVGRRCPCISPPGRSQDGPRSCISLRRGRPRAQGDRQEGGGR